MAAAAPSAQISRSVIITAAGFFLRFLSGFGTLSARTAGVFVFFSAVLECSLRRLLIENTTSKITVSATAAIAAHIHHTLMTDTAAMSASVPATSKAR